MHLIKFEKTTVKQAAQGRWKEVFESLGIHFEIGVHQPCPKCGGTDRFRTFDDFESTGGMICGAGGCDKKFADGFAAVEWYTDCTFQEAVDKVGDLVGAEPKKQKKRQPIDRLNLDRRINDLFLPYFLDINEGITERGLGKMRATTGNFDGEAVMAFPCWQDADRGPTNQVIMGAMTRKIWHRENGRDVQVRKKTLAKGWGLMGDVAGLAAADLVWKCEGPTDCAAFLSHLNECCVTNIHGAGESPEPMTHLFAGKTVNLVHDPDEAGQRGAEKWIDALRRVGCSVRNVRLPEDTDLRQFLIERGVAELLELANQAELLPPLDGTQPEANQGPESQPVEISAYDRRLVPDECIETLTSLQLEVVCQDDEGQVTVYSRATGLVRTIKSIERLQLANLLTFGGIPCYHQVVEGMEEDVSKISIRDVRKAIGIAASSKQVAGKVELRGHGIYSTQGDVVLCNGKHLSIYTSDGQWVRTERPFHRELVFGFDGAGHDWYDHDELGRAIESARDPRWCADWVERIRSYIDRWSFGHQKTDPLLMTGLVLASFVQQSWSWRPQVSIRGQSGCGKSMLFQLLFGGDGKIGLFNGAALKISLSSAAGIRQKIKSSSVVLGIDEFDQIRKPQEILNLIRTAGRGEKMIMGSAHHKHMEFGLTNICWLAGIFISLDAEADQNRFIELDLEKPREPKRSEFQMPTMADIMAAHVPLVAIAVANATKAALISQEAYARVQSDEKHVNDRIVENMSVPASMLAVATGGGVDDAAKFIDLFLSPIRSTVEVVATQDEMLSELLEATIEIGSGSKMNVAEVISGRDDSVHVVQVEKQIGVAKRMDDDGNDWLVICPKVAAKHVHKNAQDRGSVNPAGLRQVLCRIDGAILSRARLGGIRHRCVWIPWSHVSSMLSSDEREF